MSTKRRTATYQWDFYNYKLHQHHAGYEVPVLRGFYLFMAFAAISRVSTRPNRAGLEKGCCCDAASRVLSFEGL